MPDFLFGPVPHADAIDFIRSKPVVSREVFDQLLPELKARAFVISGVECANTTQRVRDRIAELPAGGDWNAIKKDVASDISPFLVDENADPEERDAQIASASRRAELLIRTHGFQAYQTAAFQVADRQKDVFPYFQYVTMEDHRVRSGHAALDGIILPQDSVFWRDHYPPWDYGCRCQCVPISQEDHDAEKEKDDEREPDDRMILDQARTRELEVSGRLVRGPNRIANVQSPVAAGKPNAFVFHPGNLRIPIAQLQQRYDADVWQAFRWFATTTEISEGQTVWQWINGSNLDAVPDETFAWPKDLSKLKTIKSLGGSTGAMLVEDATGKRFVLKKGNSAQHIREEHAADQAYRALGANVPEARLYDTPQGPAKLAEHIEGVDLRSYLAKAKPAEAAAVSAEIQKGFAADALLGNWDVAGLNLDNILVDAAGQPWRIDNGGSLRFRAQGAPKTPEQWSEFPIDLWSMRDSAANAQTGKLFGRLDSFTIARQIEAIDRPALLAALPAELHPVMGARLDNLAAVATKALDMEHDDWKAEYADELTRHMIGLRQVGIVGRLPKRLDQAPGGVLVKDEHGTPFDNLRSRPNAAAATPAVNLHPKDKFSSELIAAAKNVNAHNSKGDFAYNAGKIQSALAHEPTLTKLAKSKDADTKAMAEHYLDAVRHLKSSIAAGQAKTVVSVPTIETYKPAAAKTPSMALAANLGSIVKQVADYMKTQGADQAGVAAWMASHAGSSWGGQALAYKHFVASKRRDGVSAHFWHTSSAKTAKTRFDALAAAHGGEEKLSKAMTIWHAFVQETLAAVDTRYNDRQRRVVRLIRTEKKTAMTQNKIALGAKGAHMKRGVNESCSIFKDFYYQGDAVTVQAVPHSRITALYTLEREPGHGSGSFAGDHENEYTATLHGVPLNYLAPGTLTLDDGSDATQWKLDLTHLRSA